MHRAVSSAFVAVLAACLLGCLDLDEEYTLNPDGSGKVVVRMTYSPFRLNLNQQESDPVAAMKDSVREELEKSKGVEAWKDVSFKLGTDGKVSFHGTAYFKDFQKLDLHHQGFEGPVKKAILKTLADGRRELVFSMEEEEAAEKADPAPALTDEEVDQRVRTERAKYQQMKPMFVPFLNDMRFRIRMRVPGTVQDVNNLRKEADGSVSFALEGKKMLEVMDASFADDDWMRRQVREGRGDLTRRSPRADDILMERLMGSKGPARAVYAPGTDPLFDYASEAAAAKAASPAMLKRLDLAVAPPPPPAREGSFRSLEVVGVRLVYETDSRKGISPLNTNEPGLTFSILGGLPGRVLDVREGKLQAAIADNGQDLLPQREWSRKIHFPRLSEDKQSVLFEVQMKLPSKEVRTLKEVSGTLEYAVGDRTREVDLGFASLAAGAGGKEYGAKIEKIGKSEWQEGQETLELNLTIARETIESTVFYDTQGNKLDVDASGYMSSGRSTTLSFSKKGKFPPDGRIALKVYEDLKTFEAPFKLENVPILGR